MFPALCGLLSACGFPHYFTPGTDADGDPTVCDSEACGKCPDGFADCDSATDNGCETAVDSDTNCGMCGLSCENEHGRNACVLDDDAPVCRPTCAPSYADCDLRLENGCETKIQNDSSNCGGCGQACPSQGGTPVCVAGKCGVSSCNAGFGDCDNVGSCTFNLNRDPENCGQCGRVCSAAHGTPLCNAGVCEIACEPGYGDCNGGSVEMSPPNDGCETKLNVPDSSGDVADCGACGAACRRRAYTSVNLKKCAQGECFRDCWPDAHDCDGQRNDPLCTGSGCGCEFTECD